MGTIVLWLGTAVGVVFGVLHAGYVYRHEVSEVEGALRRRPAATRARAGYYALWTFALWVVFGTYVLVLWAIAVVVYAVYKVLAPAAGRQGA